MDEKFGCVKCGYIGHPDGEKTIIDGHEYNICSKCGNDNVGGYPCFLEWSLWPEEMQKEIIEINKE